MKRKRNDLTIYDDVADQWWSDDIKWVRTLKAMVPGRLAFFNQYGAWAGERVLDLGCAGGFMAETLHEMGAEVTGIDPAEQAIRAASLHAIHAGYGIQYDVGVGEALPYEDASFDAVVCVDVLEHVSDLDQVLREVHRVLVPGGRFFFDTINRNIISRLAVITVAEDVLRLLPKGTHDPSMFIKPAELEVAMERAGFIPGPTTGLGPTGINKQLDFKFGPLPLRTVIYMGVADKRSDDV